MTSRESYTDDQGRLWVQASPEVTFRAGGWLRFSDVIPGAYVDVKVSRYGTGWRLMGLHVEPHDGEPIRSRDLDRISVPELRERAGEYLSFDVGAVFRRSRREKDTQERRRAVLALVASVEGKGGSRADVVKRLIDVYGISRAGAYRWLADAEGEANEQAKSRRPETE